jgi:hypothetical protein
MSITVDRRARTSSRGRHEHTRACWWDHLEARWAGPDHPPDPRPAVPAPRPPSED